MACGLPHYALSRIPPRAAHCQPEAGHLDGTGGPPSAVFWTAGRPQATQKGRLRLAARHSSRGGAVRRMMIMSRLLFLRADRLCDTCRSGTAPSRSWSFPNACAAPVADAQPSDHSPPRSMRTSASIDMPDPRHDAREFTVTGDSSTRAGRQLQRNDDRRTDSTLCQRQRWQRTDLAAVRVLPGRFSRTRVQSDQAAVRLISIDSM
jgi:hypothetical protein